MITNLGNGCYVFNAGEEVADDSYRLVNFRKHMKSCCLAGHNCRNGEACKRKCRDCHEEAMAAWNGKKYRLSREATALLRASKTRGPTTSSM